MQTGGHGSSPAVSDAARDELGAGSGGDVRAAPVNTDGGRPSPAEEPAASTSYAHLSAIPARVPIVLRLPSTKHKPVTLIPGRVVSLGKFGSFRADDLIGLPFEHTYEIVGGQPQRNKPGELRMVANKTLAELEETDATNEYINDDGDSQKLSYVDIKQLKDAGLEGRELVERTLQSNKNFEQRTVYSQDKFISRKEAKHLRLFTPLHPDAATICAFQFERAPEKIRNLRPDAMAHCLAYGSVRPGGRYIIIDGVGGLLVGAVLERLGGSGRVLVINDADSPPPFDVLHTITSLPRSWMSNTLRSIHWAATEPSWQPKIIPAANDGNKLVMDRDRARLRKRRQVYDAMQATREELYAGFFDGLLMCANLEPLAVLERLGSKLAGSAKVVIHTPHQQPLLETQAELRKRPDWLHIQVVEPWARRYQVLPGRTHPEMTTSASAGYILSAIKVFDSETAEQLAAAHRLEVEAKTSAGASTAAQPDASLDDAETEPEVKRARIEQ